MHKGLPVKNDKQPLIFMLFLLFKHFPLPLDPPVGEVQA